MSAVNTRPVMRDAFRIAALATATALMAAVFVAQNARPVWADDLPGGTGTAQPDPGGTPLAQSPFTPASLHTPMQ